MREHSLLMKGPLVRATLEGRKTQTRRPIKCGCNEVHKNGNPVQLFGDWSLSVPPHSYDGIEHLYGWIGKRPEIGDWIETVQTDVDDCLTSRVSCPFGKTGDRLWVRETFAIVHPCRDCEAGYVDDIKQPSVIPKDNAGGYWVPWYRSDWKGDDDTERGFQWTPSIHMPRWASRIVLPLMSIRVERVQDITEEDAIAEGVPHNSDRPIDKSWCAACCGHGIVERFALGMVFVDDCSECNSAKKLFRNIWISIYGQESWDANPWVWVAKWEDIEVSR